jgi:hypothetical protein
MRNRAKHFWLAAIIVANCPSRAKGQGDLAVSVLGTTPTQAILSYTAPTDAPCIVEASASAEYWPPLHDLDLLLFEDANGAGRGGSFAGARQRAILIGTPLTDTGRGNTAYSQALQPDTLYYFRITCGPAVAVGAFRTVQLTSWTTDSHALLPSQNGPGIPVPALFDISSKSHGLFPESARGA